MSNEDPTEDIRREMIETGQPMTDLIDELVEERETWTTEEAREEFEFLQFMAPFVIVRRKSTGEKGTIEFTHNPRVYFGWKAD